MRRREVDENALAAAPSCIGLCAHGFPPFHPLTPSTHPGICCTPPRRRGRGHGHSLWPSWVLPLIADTRYYYTIQVRPPSHTNDTKPTPPTTGASSSTSTTTSSNGVQPITSLRATVPAMVRRRGRGRSLLLLRLLGGQLLCPVWPYPPPRRGGGRARQCLLRARHCRWQRGRCWWRRWLGREHGRGRGVRGLLPRTPTAGGAGHQLWAHLGTYLLSGEEEEEDRGSIQPTRPAFCLVR